MCSSYYFSNTICIRYLLLWNKFQTTNIYYFIISKSQESGMLSLGSSGFGSLLRLPLSCWSGLQSFQDSAWPKDLLSSSVLCVFADLSSSQVEGLCPGLSQCLQDKAAGFPQSVW